MKVVRWLHPFVVLTIVLSSVVVFAPIADAQTIHALLVFMEADPSIGAMVSINKTNIEHLLKQIQDEGVCRVKQTVLSSRNPGETTRDRIRQWLRDVRPSENDVIFIYYSGHGGMTRAGETFLATEGVAYYRKVLVEDVEEAKTCRLKILITDACSSSGPEKTQPNLNPPPLKSALINLFVEHKGFLHITAATEGQFGFIDSDRGGWFTFSLITAILTDRPDADDDNFLSWEEVFERTRYQTMDLFKRIYPHFPPHLKEQVDAINMTTQEPKYYGELPKRTRQ